jgi:hypothetical protein
MELNSAEAVCAQIQYAIRILASVLVKAIVPPALVLALVDLE